MHANRWTLLHRVALRLVCGAALAAAATFAQAANPCQGTPHCQDLGPFTATAVKVNVTRQDRVTAYQGVRTTVRFTNTGTRPIVLAYRDRTIAVSDDQGLAYRWSSKATGIGVVSRGSADAQFRLEPGESREASFEGVLQYSMRSQVAGHVFQHDFTIVELAQVGPQQLREVRDYAVSFSQLTATSGAGATAAPQAAATAAATPAPVAAAAAAAPGCDGAPACQVQGPLQASVVRVVVTHSGRVTEYQTVRTTLRLRNLGDQPLIVGYRKNSSMVSDDQGLAYRWSSKADGIGLVDGGSADPQFRLAPGESRDASFESTLQYNVRSQTPGRVFQHDLTLVALQIVGPSQVRSVADYAFSFSNISASSGIAPGAANAAEAVSKVVDLFKAFKK